MSNSIRLSGTLIGGIVGPGAETTGFVLKLSDIDIDLSGLERPALVPGNRYLVFGNLEERVYPVRGRVQVLRARGLASTAGDLSRTDLSSSVFLTGTVRTDIVRPGGETTGVTLVGAIPEVDLSAIPEKPSNGDVTVHGRFELVQYVLRGAQFVFKASSLKVIKPQPLPPMLPARAAEVLAAAAAAQPGAPVNGVYYGYSDSFSLEEAILDAVKQVPMPDIADWLTSVRVEAIGAEFGGIAGVSRLKVAITAALPG